MIRFALTAAGAAWLASCSTGSSPCTPAAYGLGAAAALTSTVIDTYSVDRCESGARAVATQAELEAVWGDFRAAADGGGASILIVDFTKERVIVLPRPSNLGTAWAVVDGDRAVFGLLSCGNATSVGCIVDALRVEAVVSSAETRTCESVACGQPTPAPAPHL